MNLKALVKGYIGEKINSILLQQLPVNEYHIINNLILRLPDGSTTQIDHVIVSAYGIFVIETKNYKGKIYGTERAGQWTQYLGQKSYPFMNPLHQNYKHVMALRQMTGLEKDCFISIVAFSDEAKLKIHTTSHVVTFGEIVRTIRSYRVLKIAPDPIWLWSNNADLQWC